MTAEGEVAPVLMAVARWRGRILIFVKILPPEASRSIRTRWHCPDQSDLAISSFMISLVPP
jgi:hypothetical protein